MYGQKKKPTAKPNSVDTLIKKLAELSPSVDLLVASALGGYSLYASFVDSAKLVGLICLLFSSVFAVMGIASIMRQMKDCRMIEENANPEALRAMKTAQFEKFLIALFKLDGYRVRLAIDELHRLDDADLILERKKETILLQYNHWDEEAVGIKPLQSLYKAASNFRAHGCLVVTCGGFTPEARDWAQRKGVVLMNMDDILAMARRLTGSSQSPTIPLQEDSLQVEGQQGELEISGQYLFVDFAGLADEAAKLAEFLSEHPRYQVVATTLPTGAAIDAVRAGLGELGSRIIGAIIPNPAGRYFAIQDYLRKSPSGRAWLALDTEPRQFPEGCSELVAVNRSFGFDASSARRLREAMQFSESRGKLLSFPAGS